jgi:phosphatidylserine decarboxylase
VWWRNAPAWWRAGSWNAPGDLLAQGDRYGLIRFGSRTDVYLPAERWEACVSAGDRVVGGETVIARVRGASETL